MAANTERSRVCDLTVACSHTSIFLSLSSQSQFEFCEWYNAILGWHSSLQDHLVLPSMWYYRKHFDINTSYLYCFSQYIASWARTLNSKTRQTRVCRCLNLYILSISPIYIVPNLQTVTSIRSSSSFWIIFLPGIDDTFCYFTSSLVKPSSSLRSTPGLVILSFSILNTIKSEDDSYKIDETICYNWLSQIPPRISAVNTEINKKPPCVHRDYVN